MGRGLGPLPAVVPDRVRAGCVVLRYVRHVRLLAVAFAARLEIEYFYIINLIKIIHNYHLFTSCADTRKNKLFMFNADNYIVYTLHNRAIHRTQLISYLTQLIN